MSSTNIEGDTYPVLRTEKESARLFSQLGLISHALGGLVHAPIDLSRLNLRILDVGTGTGRWLSMLSDTLPQPARDTVTLQGTDIAPYPNTPQGISIKLLNFKDPFPEEWEESFDLVHMGSCLMMSPGDAAHELIAKLAKLVKPGGWLQLSDTSLEPGPILDTDKPHQRLYKTMAKCVLDMGMDPIQGGRLPALLGGTERLVEVGTKAAPIKIGKTASPKFKEQSLEYINFLFGNLEHAADILNIEGVPQLKADVLDEAKTDGFDFMYQTAWAKRT